MSESSFDLRKAEAAFQKNKKNGYSTTVKLSSRRRLETQEEWLARVGENSYIQPYKVYRVVNDQHVWHIVDTEQLVV